MVILYTRTPYHATQTSISFNPFSPTLFLIVAKMSQPKPGRQRPECQKLEKEWVRPVALDTLKSNHLTPLGLKGLIGCMSYAIFF